MAQRLQHLRTRAVESGRHPGSTSPDLSPAGPITTYFQQPCPTCGCPLLILVEHLGKQVFCSHCRRAFVARDVSQDRGDAEDVGRSLLSRAERLLGLLELSSRRRRVCNV